MPRNCIVALKHFKCIYVGLSGIGLLEDAIREQHLEKVVALLEHGFSPNGEQGSSKVGPIFEILVSSNCMLSIITKILVF